MVNDSCKNICYCIDWVYVEMGLVWRQVHSLPIHCIAVLVFSRFLCILATFPCIKKITAMQKKKFVVL